MDKFTVDLDQVLNDFEYSELTDQYSSTVKITDNSSPAAPTQNITKHSINNVFHSLNEYLNSSIPVNSLETADNNINEDSLEVFPSTTEEKSINKDLVTPTNVNFKNHTINQDFSLVKKDNSIEAEEKDVDISYSSEINFDKAHSSIERDYQGTKDNSEHDDILEMPFDTSILKYDSSENHIDLHTELQNVFGNNFGINNENHPTNSLSEVEKFKPIIGFEQALHLDDQEINKLLSELEEDDEINVDIKESQNFAVNDIGCETRHIELIIDESK